MRNGFGVLSVFLEGFKQKNREQVCGPELVFFQGGLNQLNVEEVCAPEHFSRWDLTTKMWGRFVEMSCFSRQDLTTEIWRRFVLLRVFLGGI